MVVAIMILVFGIVLIAFPVLLEGIFAGCAAIVPVSTGMTGYLCAIILSFIVMTMIFNVAKRKKVLYYLRVFMSIISFLALLGILLMILHQPLSKLYDSWHTLLIDNYTIFIILRYVGILMIVGALGFFGGKRYQKRQKDKVKLSKNDPNYSVNTFGRSSHEVKDSDLDTHLPEDTDL